MSGYSNSYSYSGSRQGRMDDNMDDKQNLLNGKVVKGLKMSDGTAIEGYIVGIAPFTYILPQKEVDKICCTGQQQVRINIVAERILANN